MNSSEQAIRALHDIWTAAINSANLDLLLTLITDDLVLMGPGLPSHGKKEFLASFRDAHAQLRLQCVSDLREVVIVGAVAYTCSHDTLTFTPRAGGATTELSGDRLTVYRQQSDGRWLLARNAHTLTEKR